ncbi:MAG TPA: PTS sugar transporter subunit IIA, partial [Pirellulales bacterium]
MAEEDFDIHSLAAYLHLQVAQVARLADRGKFPGRKVQGQWRFSQADIHHWLENRIGLSDEAELEKFETILRPPTAHRNAPRAISELLTLTAIEVPLQARTRSSVISSMAELAARTGWLWDAQKMAAALLDREEMHPTALDNGVALLHPRRPMTSILGQEFLAFGRTASGIPFGGDHGGLTDLFFLLCSTDDRGHLQTLARLSRLITEPALLTKLREVSDAQAIHS